MQQAMTLGIGLALAGWLTAGCRIAQGATPGSDRGVESVRYEATAVLPVAAGDNPLYAGWATADVTPQKPVNLVGQYEKRIARTIRDPLTATVLALETRGDTGSVEHAILVSCDVISIPKAVAERLREKLEPRLPDVDVRKVLLNGTHTHTAPGLAETAYKPYDVSGDPGVMRPAEYAEWFVDRVAAAVIEAWQNRKPAGLSWALGHASVGTNRRAVSFDGKSAMYGDTGAPGFSHVEGDPVHPVELHVIRLGDAMIATSPFELFMDYGIRLKARSKAVLTLLVQLAGQDCGYLPTERAVRGGGYSAENYRVGPEGGQLLVEETLKHINALFPP